MDTTVFTSLLVRPAGDRLRLDTTTRAPAAGERALVLGGGGAVGNAWSIGVLAGLLEAGLDVTGADLLVGTSAGATTAVQISSADPAELLAATLAAAPPPRPSGGGLVGLAADRMDRTAEVIAAAGDPADMRRRLGAAALELGAEGGWTARWRQVVAARLPRPDWPAREVLLTAVDAGTGQPVVFDRRSGVDLTDAVAASCSSGAPYVVDGRPYLDGGYRRSAENADLAAGYARVLVLTPFGGRTRTPPHWGMQLAGQVDELRAGGSRVETVAPEVDVEQLLGARAVDPALRPPAARSGAAQGRALAGRLAAFWS